MTFSPEVLAFFARLLSQVTLNVGADDFEETAATAATAKREVQAALAALGPAEPES